MINDCFDADSKPIVTLDVFLGPKKKLLDKCLVLFSKHILAHLLQEHECEKLAEVEICNGNMDVWCFEHRGEKIAFYLSPLGSALAGAAVAKANHLTGATRFIMFGSCGSLDSSRTEGKFILPTQAYRGEGLSYYFAAPADYIEIKNSERLADIFTELKVPFVKGRVWTTDSMLRETVNLVERRKREGCIAVEMEIAGVQAVCDFYGWEVYDFLASGDVLTKERYTIKGLSGANHNLDKLQIALCIAERI